MKTILITGATSGIGKAFVDEYKTQATIIAVGRNEAKLKELGVEYVVCDIANNAHEVAARITSKHTVDILINNAGVGTPTDLTQITEDDIDSMFDTNVKGLILFTKPILAQMKEKKKGHVINIGSTAGLESNPVAPVYCATKFAVEAYSNGLREQVRDANIKVTTIRPDKVSTNYWGERDVPRDTFLTSLEVAQSIWYVTTLPSGANIKDLTIEAVR